VIDHLSSKYSGENTCVIHVYCDYRDKEKQTAENMVGALLNQTIASMEDFPSAIHKSLQDYLTTQYTKGALFQDGHFEIARICLTYISFEIPVTGPEHLKSDRDILK
jgi:hypothetical protein